MGLINVIYIGVISFVCIALAVFIKKVYKNSNKKQKASETRQIKIKLTIRAIIKWEQLNQKAFTQMNYGNENDIVSLFYVCAQSDVHNLSLSEFKEKLTEESLKEMIQDFDKQTLLDSQYQHISKKKIEKSKASDPVYIKDIASALIMNGLPADFALNEMTLNEMTLFSEAHDQIQRNRYEEERLWTFLKIRPHVSSKKSMKPSDLILFEWEVEDRKQKAKETLEKGASTFEIFMNSSKQI